MQSKTPPEVARVVHREDKFETLRTFIHAALLNPATTVRSADISLVARSADSPAARALVSLSDELGARRVGVRAIFACLEPEVGERGWLLSGAQFGICRDLRWAKNPRLGDAHEQLVLGGGICWTGDCLRRDPNRRDAYEQYATAAPETARVLSVSFERLWRASEPLAIRSLSDTMPGTEHDTAVGQPLATQPGRDENAGPLVSSSH